MGVPYETFWHLNPYKLEAFIKAHKLREQIEDTHAWQQGAYVYEAIACLVPVLHAFAKKGTKPKEYPDKPYFKRNEVAKLAEKGEIDVKDKKLQAQAQSVLMQLQMMQRAFEQTHPKKNNEIE